MTAVKSLVGEKILIQIGDGGSPTEIFTHDCLINTDRGVKMSADPTEVLVPDCDDPSAPAWKQVFMDGLSIAVSGSGVLHTTSAKTFFNWLTSGAAKNVRILLNTTGALGGGYISGSFKLSSFDITGQRKNNSTADIALVSDGPCTWTDAA